MPVSEVAGRQHLRSARCHQLLVPRVCRSTFATRVFSVAGTRVWNSRLIICGIQLLTPNDLGETWRRICSVDIRCVSALEVSRNRALQINVYLLTYLLTFTAPFSARRSYASAVLEIIIILPVGCTRALWQNQTMHCKYFDTARKGNQFRFLAPTVVGGRLPFHLKFALNVAHPFEKLPTSTDLTYNCSTVKETAKKVQLRQIESRPWAFQWPIDVVRKLPLSSKGWLKKRFLFFKNTIQFQSNNVCYEISSCENF